MFRQNYGIVWIFHCWNGLFGINKPHQKVRVLFSSCKLRDVLTINISPAGKWWQRAFAAIVKKSNWRKQNVSLLVHNHKLDFNINLLIFVRSIRKGYFSLYLSSLREVVKWYYTCDNYQYARWVTAFLYDLVNLPSTSSYLDKCFTDGSFAFQKSNRKSSFVEIDQAHEQNNAVIKGMGGGSSLLNKDDESGLARWKRCLLELSMIIN